MPHEIPRSCSLLRPSFSRKFSTEPRHTRGTSMSTDWDVLFSKQEQQTYRVDMKHSTVPLTRFLTGSCYEGGWDILGMSGFGTYTFPHGVKYEGNFRDGEFHGEGTLIYPMGQRVHGMWSSGNLISWSYQFNSGLEFDETWRYCKYPDRRFQTSIKDGLSAVGRERTTCERYPRTIPQGCYDTGDGFYHPRNKCVTSVRDESTILRIPSKLEAEWIKENCRKAWDEPTGYRPDLYSSWVTGRRTSTVKLEDEYSDKVDATLSKIFNWA